MQSPAEVAQISWVHEVDLSTCSAEAREVLVRSSTHTSIFRLTHAAVFIRGCAAVSSVDRTASQPIGLADGHLRVRLEAKSQFDIDAAVALVRALVTGKACSLRVGITSDPAFQLRAKVAGPDGRFLDADNHRRALNL